MISHVAEYNFYLAEQKIDSNGFQIKGEPLDEETKGDGQNQFKNLPTLPKGKDDSDGNNARRLPKRKRPEDKNIEKTIYDDAYGNQIL